MIKFCEIKKHTNRLCGFINKLIIKIIRYEYSLFWYKSG